MKLTNEQKLALSVAMLQGDQYVIGDAMMFPLSPTEYCVQKMAGPVTDENRIITKSWDEALKAFEAFLDDGVKPKELHEYNVRIILSEMTIIAESEERAEEIAMEIYRSDARTQLSHGLCVECCEVDDEGVSDETEETSTEI